MNPEFIIHMIAKIHDQANKFLIKNLKAHNIAIAPSHGDVIGALCLKDEMTMSELAAYINKDKSTVTALVNKLVNLGYVEKNAAPDDNRVCLVSLKDKGKSIKPEILGISKRMRDKAYRNFTQKEKQMLMELLLKIHRNF